MQIVRGGSFLTRGMIFIGIAVSIYSAAIAPDWGTELANQVARWSAAIAGSELGTGVGTLIAGPISAILGAIAGSILGAIGAGALAHWLFGSNSSLSAVQLLDQALNPSSELVAKKISDIRENLLHTSCSRRAQIRVSFPYCRRGCLCY